MKAEGLKAAFLPEHIENPIVLENADDVDLFIESLLRGTHDRNCAVVYSLDRPLLPSGYLDHELSVGVDRVAQVGTLAFLDDDNYAPRGSMNRGVVEYMQLGHAKEFMAGSELPISLIRRAVKEFLVSGGQIPKCIEWQKEAF